jgi:hypothetical protein
MVRTLTTALLALCLLAVAAAPASAQELLPDLVQNPPYEMGVASVRDGGTQRYHLGFASNVQNWGSGPLEVHGTRPSQDQPQMAVEQIVTSADGTRTARPGAGVMRFVTAPSHNHWHYLKFDIYELRRARDYKIVAPDQKTGFCLGDRFVLDYPAMTSRTGDPFFTSGCGYDEPELLEMTEGISVGYGDNYSAQLEGQFLDITRVPAGDYYVVHRVNSERKLREENYANNVASAGIRITWPNGRKSRPKIVQMKVCRHSDHCPFARRQKRGKQWRPTPGQPRVVAPAPRIVPARAGIVAYCPLVASRTGA